MALSRIRAIASYEASDGGRSGVWWRCRLVIYGYSESFLGSVGWIGRIIGFNLESVVTIGVIIGVEAEAVVVSSGGSGSSGGY